MKNFYGMLMACACIFSILLSGQPLVPNFELWNKHNQPLYYSISQNKGSIMPASFKELRPGKRIADTLDLTKPTTIALALETRPTAGTVVDRYTIRPGKTIYARVGLPSEKEKLKETFKSILQRTSFEHEQYIFGPQTGPLLGLKGVTEQGYPLKNNFSTNDVTYSRSTLP